MSVSSSADEVLSVLSQVFSYQVQPLGRALIRHNAGTKMGMEEASGRAAEQDWLVRTDWRGRLQPLSLEAQEQPECTPGSAGPFLRCSS